MDLLPSVRGLPNEIAQAIFLEAVQVRGVTRAGRLRLVSRAWDAAVLEAIFKSGILDDQYQKSKTSPYWPQYLTYRILHTNTPLTNRFRIVRQVAARVLASRGQDPSGNALESCVLDICSLCPVLVKSGGYYNNLAPGPIPSNMEMVILETSSGNIDENGIVYKGALLSAAACTNDAAVVAEVLPHIQDCFYLLCQDGMTHPSNLLPYPIDVAAYKGNLEVLALLVEAIATSSTASKSQLSHAMEQIAVSAAQGGQVEVLRRYPQIFSMWQYTLKDCFHLNTSVEVFHWLANVAITLHPRNKNYGARTKGFRNQLGVAIRQGATALMEHMCERDPFGLWREDYGEDVYNLISIAAKANRDYAVKYFLAKGLPIGTDALEHASKHGNIPMMTRLLARYAFSQNVLRKSLLHAVSREHESVFRLLMECGTTMDNSLATEALLITKADGLDSMSTLIGEYQ